MPSKLLHPSFGGLAQIGQGVADKSWTMMAECSSESSCDVDQRALFPNQRYSIVSLRRLRSAGSLGESSCGGE